MSKGALPFLGTETSKHSFFFSLTLKLDEENISHRGAQCDKYQDTRYVQPTNSIFGDVTDIFILALLALLNDLDTLLVVVRLWWDGRMLSVSSLCKTGDAR